MSMLPEERIEDDDDDTTEAPLTMAASVILSVLPKDASKALESAGTGGPEKIVVRFHALGSAPQLTQKVFKISSSQRFETIVRFVRKKLSVKDHESVFCYVHNVFSPGLDESILSLWNCFKVGEELVVGYAMAPAFG